MLEFLRHLFKRKRKPLLQKISGDLLPRKNFLLRHKKKFIIGACVLLALVLLAGVLALIYIPKFKEMQVQAKDAKTYLDAAQKKIVAQDFSGAEKDITTSQSSFNQLESSFASLSWVRWIPYIRTQYSAVDHALNAADHVYTGIHQLLTISQTIFLPIQKNSASSIKQISPEDKEQILAGLNVAEPTLRSIENEFSEANKEIELIPKNGVLPFVNSAVAPIHDQIPKLTKTIQSILPLSRILPTFLGYQEEKQYLLLFQNNTELRPTGGFIGTYGIFKIKNGEIISLQSDNVYNLDEAARKQGLSLPAPEPLFRYNKVDKLFLRDSNWSPDFPTSAQLALSLYKKEGGREKNPDGVIAIDPTLMTSLLAITGPITVRGITFDKENFITKLQDHVTQDFKYAGIESADRKDIIGELAQVMIEKLFTLPKNRWQELFIAFESNLASKHLLIWLQDQKAQEVLNANDWDGHMPTFSGFGLSIIDANLASLKTDPAVVRKNSVSIKQEQDASLLVKLERTYANTGKLTWKTTRYRTFSRVFVPKGSTLLSSEGTMEDCKIPSPDPAGTGEDLGNTVFSYFLCVEPGETKVITLTYKIPQPSGVSANSIPFDFIKQAGTSTQQTNVSIELTKSIQSINPVDKEAIIKDNQLLHNFDLVRDATFTLELH